MNEQQSATARLLELGIRTIRELDYELGILASSKTEIFGCVFGRDSAITALKLLRAYATTHDEYLLALVKKIVINLFMLLGKEVNIESGEQPGKGVHEYRITGHERLTKQGPRPWYVYPDGTMRNYDSVDSTPLLLIALYRYWQQSRDRELLDIILPSVKLALAWLLEYGDSNRDGLIDYHLPTERKCGGLIVQSWMDSRDSVFHEDGTEVVFPVAPVEVQGYAFLALRLWANYFANFDLPYSSFLAEKARRLKIEFNQKYVLTDGRGYYLASGIDGNDKPIVSVRSSMGHCLWASLRASEDGITESIVDNHYVPDVVRRLLSPDIFEPEAGIRTLSAHSLRFDPHSYHNGSIWPHDNSIIEEGMALHGFHIEAARVRRAILKALVHFDTPIELFVYDQGCYEDWVSSGGQHACKKQAWSAAALLVESLAEQSGKLYKE